MIRAFKPADEDDLIRVSLASTISGLPEEHWQTMEPVIRSELIPLAEIWVIERNGELLSFMALLGNMISGLFTHPDHQDEGYGRALVEYARSRFDPLFVEVFEANDKALGFYRRCWFVDHERRMDESSGLPLLILRMEWPDPK